MKNERGSFALEAALTLPLFLFVCIALVWLLQLARIESALQEAVDEAVKTTAAHSYPLDLLVHAYRENPNIQALEQQIERFLPYSVKAMLQDRLQRQLPIGGGAARVWSDASIHDRWATPFVLQFADRDRSGRPYLQEERLTIRSVAIPTFLSDETSYFGIEAEYRVNVPVPFVNKTIVLSAASIERCWVGEK